MQIRPDYARYIVLAIMIGSSVTYHFPRFWSKEMALENMLVMSVTDEVPV